MNITHIVVDYKCLLKEFYSTKYYTPAKLGAGAFGSVRIYDSQFSQINTLDILEEVVFDKNKRDYEVLQILQHKNVLTLFYSHIGRNPSNFPYLSMYTQLCKENLGGFMKNSITIICRELRYGLDYLHRNKIVLRNIKPENVVVNNGKQHDMAKLKIGDFEQAQFISKFKEVSVRGTLPYTSPEMHQAVVYNDRVSDVFSLGIIFFEMLSKKTPSSSLYVARKDADERMTAGMIHDINVFDRLFVNQDKFGTVYRYSQGKEQPPILEERIPKDRKEKQQRQRQRNVLPHFGPVISYDQIAVLKNTSYVPGGKGAADIKADILVPWLNAATGDMVVDGRHVFASPGVNFDLTGFAQDVFLGYGRFGQVFKYSKLGEGEYKDVAVKKLPLPVSTFDAQGCEEIRTMTNLSHVNVVQFLGYCKIDQMIAIVMELCLCDLQNVMASKLNFEIYEVGFLISQVCQGLAYLHTEGFIHRDIKPKNILVQCSKRLEFELLVSVNDLVLKISDFGLARLLDDDATSATMTVVGTPLYEAPEVRYAKYGKVHYSKRADVYSLGLVTYNLLRRNLSKLIQEDEDIGKQGIGAYILAREKLKEPNAFSDFLSVCVPYNSAARQTSQQLLQHPFIVGLGQIL